MASNLPHTAIGMLYMFYAVLIVVVNVLLIISLFATKQSMLNASNFLIVCLSASDTVIGAVLLPILGYRRLSYPSAVSYALHKISSPLQYYLFAVTAITSMLLVIDRYNHMNPNFRSPSKLQKFFERPTIYATVFIASCVLPAVFSAAFHLTTINHPETIPYALLCFDILSILFITACLAVYIHGYVRIRRFVAENQIHANSNESPEYLRELFKTVFILLLVLFISCIPAITHNIIYLISVFQQIRILQPKTMYVLHKVSTFLFYTNSLANALIIFYRNKASKDWVLALFRTRFCNSRVQAEP